MAGDSVSLPPWMRLYFYGMHGLTLDILVSAARRFVSGNRDLRMLGFSSPYRGAVHALTHLVLEKVYEQKRCFLGRPLIFHLVFYPSIYIGLQILVGNMSMCTEQARVVSATQLAVHYILALYFTGVFHKGLSRLHYHCSRIGRPTPDDASQGRVTGQKAHNTGQLPGIVRFLFFGMHGFVDEVLFTSVFSLVEGGSVSGHTSLWSFLMYGSCSFAVEKLYLYLHYCLHWGALRRLPIYICFIYSWELSWGLVLRRVHACSWDYSHYPLNFMGLITLLYLPGWVLLSLYQDVLSNVLLRVRCRPTQGDGGLNGRPLPRKKHVD